MSRTTGRKRLRNPSRRKSLIPPSSAISVPQSFCSPRPGLRRSSGCGRRYKCPGRSKHLLPVCNDWRKRHTALKFPLPHQQSRKSQPTTNTFCSIHGTRRSLRQWSPCRSSSSASRRVASSGSCESRKPGAKPAYQTYPSHREALYANTCRRRLTPVLIPGGPCSVSALPRQKPATERLIRSECHESAGSNPPSVTGRSAHRSNSRFRRGTRVRLNGFAHEPKGNAPRHRSRENPLAGWRRWFHPVQLRKCSPKPRMTYYCERRHERSIRGLYPMLRAPVRCSSSCRRRCHTRSPKGCQPPSPHPRQRQSFPGGCKSSPDLPGWYRIPEKLDHIIFQVSLPVRHGLRKVSPYQIAITPLLAPACWRTASPRFSYAPSCATRQCARLRRRSDRWPASQWQTYQRKAAATRKRKALSVARCRGTRPKIDPSSLRTRFRESACKRMIPGTEQIGRHRAPACRPHRNHWRSRLLGIYPRLRRYLWALARMKRSHDTRSHESQHAEDRYPPFLRWRKYLAVIRGHKN
ncbi:hypothetical protein [Klebsiella phage vB_KshKPC-M]|nr:hypothetical protein [Klebsiella phage vB_KshKPC-M]